MQNFRSQKRLIAWVNRLFEQWMGEDGNEGGGAGYFQAGYEAMSPRWEGDIGHPFQPCVWALADTEVEDRIDAIRRQEAEDIAGLLRQIVNQQWQTLDREATEATGREAYRPVEYSDICILMPSRTGLQILERGIEGQDIPYRLESASLIFETQEIRDLLNCLKAIDDPGNQVATVAALRSPAFGCSDVDLLRHYQGDGLEERRAARGGGAGRWWAWAWRQGWRRRCSGWRSCALGRRGGVCLPRRLRQPGPGFGDSRCGRKGLCRHVDET